MRKVFSRSRTRGGLGRLAVVAVAMLAVVAVAVPNGAFAASGDIFTWAGGAIGDAYYSFHGTIRGGSDVQYNASGNTVYISDRVGNRVRKVVSPTNAIYTVAGTGVAGFAGDGGPALAARLNRPDGVAVDAAGNLYIADTNNHRVRKVTPGGVITTVAGNGVAGWDPTDDGGPATAASLEFPKGVSVAPNGDLYIADSGNGRIRRVRLGIITTVAGGGLLNAPEGTLGSGGECCPATLVDLDNPVEVLFSSIDNGFYIADARVFIGLPNGKVFFVNSGGMISRVGGCPGPELCDDGDGGTAYLTMIESPQDLTQDPLGNLYVADRGLNKIRKINEDGNISTLAGTGACCSGFGDGGPARRAILDSPEGITAHPDGLTFAVADTGNFKVRRISFGDIGPMVGAFGDNGRAHTAWLTNPRAVATDSTGLLYVVDGIGRLRKVKGTGAPGVGWPAYILTLVGDEPLGGYDDAFFAQPMDVSVGPNDIAVFADQNDDRIFRFVATGILEVVTDEIVDPEHVAAGNTGWLTAAQKADPDNVRQPIVFTAAAGANAVTAVSKGFSPVTFAGTGACSGPLGDGGPASAARLCNPEGIATDVYGNVYIADRGNGLIRKVTFGPDGIANGVDDIITTVAAVAAPVDVSVSRYGDVQVAALAGHTVVRIVGGVPTVVAGTGSAGFGGDGGPGGAAALNTPLSVALDSFTGRVYIADMLNNRVRFIEP